MSKPATEPARAILGPAGNRVRVVEDSKRKGESLKKLQQLQKQEKPKKVAVSEMPEAVVKKNLSVDSSSSSDSNSSVSSASTKSSSRKVSKRNAVKAVAEFPKLDLPFKRCDWITSNSDPLYISFHDEEWGVPVHDDRKLFELLVYSQALAEMSWPTILHMRDFFRKHFDDFNPSSVAQFTEKKLLSLKVNGSLLLSEPKLHAIVENAKLLLKVQQEFGSFSNYIWKFVNHNSLRNGFRYARQVPVKTPKAEIISKDLMQRGFRCVGPTVIYSFMQVAGIVNDHLVSCFRYQESNSNVKKNADPKVEATKEVTKALDDVCLSQPND